MRETEGGEPDVKSVLETEPEAKYQTGWRRFFAMWIDGIFLGLVSVGFYFALDGSIGMAEGEDLDLFTQPIYSVVMTFIFGWTLGKRACGVKVVMFPDGSPVTLKAAILRDIFPIAMALCVLPLIFLQEGWGLVGGALSFVLGLAGAAWLILEIVTMLTDPQRRALHDKIAGTVVVVSARAAP